MNPIINPKHMVTLHFTSDNRVPFKVGVPYISYNTFAEAVQGLLIEPTDSKLLDNNNLVCLDSAEINKKDHTIIHLKLKKTYILMME